MFMTFLCVFQVSELEAKAFSMEAGEHFPQWFVDEPFLDLTDFQDSTGLDAQNNSAKKGLMVLYTTKGCSYCAEFIRKSLGNQKIASIVQKNFYAVGLEIFDDIEMVDPTGETISVKQFAKQEGVEFAPTLLFYDNKGKRVLHQTGYQSPERFLKLLDFVINEHYKKQSLQHFFNTISTEKSSYTLKSDLLFENAPYLLDRSHFSAGEPLLVIFEKTGCKECKTFHDDVLTVKDVRDYLKDFEVVRLDANDTTTTVLLPNGEHLTPSEWYKETKFSRLPALIFFDEKGNNVLSTDAFVEQERMINSIEFMLEKAYKKGWTYQRFARSKSISRNLKNAGKVNTHNATQHGRLDKFSPSKN